jgi:hypothetical protein
MSACKLGNIDWFERIGRSGILRSFMGGNSFKPISAVWSVLYMGILTVKV